MPVFQSFECKQVLLISKVFARSAILDPESDAPLLREPFSSLQRRIFAMSLLSLVYFRSDIPDLNVTPNTLHDKNLILVSICHCFCQKSDFVRNSRNKLCVRDPSSSDSRLLIQEYASTNTGFCDAVHIRAGSIRLRRLNATDKFWQHATKLVSKKF